MDYSYYILLDDSATSSRYASSLTVDFRCLSAPRSRSLAIVHGLGSMWQLSQLARLAWLYYKRLGTHKDVYLIRYGIGTHCMNIVRALSNCESTYLIKGYCGHVRTRAYHFYLGFFGRNVNGLRYRLVLFTFASVFIYVL